MRQGELLRLQWRDVDLSGRVITVTEAKNKTPRDVPYTDRVAALLEELLRRRVVPLDRSQPDRVLAWIPQSLPRQYRGAFRRAVREARLPPLRLHDLRHIYAVDLVRAGVPLPDVGRLLGHKTLSMTLRYSHHAPADAAHRARDLLESRRRGGAAGEVRESVARADQSEEYGPRPGFVVPSPPQPHPVRAASLGGAQGGAAPRTHSPT